MIRGLEGKVALITGAGSGIGRASALAFARERAKVVVNDVVVQSGEETVQMIKEAGGEGIFLKGDVSKSNQVEALISKTVDMYGRLDCAHNNAGIAGVKISTDKFTEEHWDSVININLKGVWLCMRYEIPVMLKQGGGAIVNTSSALGLVGIAHAPAYVASKHGINGLTKVAALEYAKLGIRVNSICPGVIRTPGLQRIIDSNPQAEATQIALEPMGRLGTPEEVAETVVWLCSDAASFITGHCMAVDGGWTAA